jgi:hypothetical protein
MDWQGAVRTLSSECRIITVRNFAKLSVAKGTEKTFVQVVYIQRAKKALL